MEIVTDRLILRRPAASDRDAVFAVHHDPRACVHNPSDRLATPADAAHLIERWDEHWRRHDFGYRVVELRADRTVIGFCGTKIVSFRGREVLNLFYRFAPDHWGHGYATEAATALVSWTAEHLPHWPVLARVRPANEASQRVALRAGLTRDPAEDAPGEDGPDWMYTARWGAHPVD